MHCLLMALLGSSPICFAASVIRAVRFQGCWKHQTESQSASYRVDYFGLLVYVRVTTFCHFSFRENKIVFHGSRATPEIRCETAVGCFKLLLPQAPCLLNTYMYTTNCRERENWSLFQFCSCHSTCQEVTPEQSQSVWDYTCPTDGP